MHSDDFSHTTHCHSPETHYFLYEINNSKQITIKMTIHSESLQPRNIVSDENLEVFTLKNEAYQRIVKHRKRYVMYKEHQK